MPTKKAKAKNQPMKNKSAKSITKASKKDSVKVKKNNKSIKKIDKKAAPKNKNTASKKLPAKKINNLAKASKKKKVAQKIIAKPVKKPLAIKKPLAAKKDLAVKKTSVKKITEKPSKKIAGKSIEKDSKLKAKSAEVKTSAKIIAKAKNSSENKNKEKEIDKAPEKKSEAQKNLIIVKKLPESRHRVTFKAGDYAVYPSHGVGKIVEIEKMLVLGQDYSCYLMYFEKEKLTIKIPVNSSEKIGLRHLVSKSQMDEVFTTLRSGVKKLKGMWSRRAQEYETKINSGDIMLLAEVLRDLTRDIEDGDRSYSERIIYETAVHRLAAEYSVIYAIDFEEAKEKIIITAKDKLGVEGKVNQKDEFDEFDYDSKNLGDEEEEEEENDEEEEEDDFDYGGVSADDDEDEDDDDKPRKKKRKK
ncbi:MAG: CarD family transcriptional regulator [Rickettsiales bacterium]|nr:CarD family transcriptional regulator [Rickettsiales bacterium]